jgi:hypothetical protein
LALASAALVHVAFASSLTCPLAALLARPLPGRGLPVTLSLALPGLLSLTLYAFPFSLAARARLLAALALLADIALLALSCRVAPAFPSSPRCPCLVSRPSRCP